MALSNDTAMQTNPQEREIIEVCGGWAKVLCKHKNCGKIYSVPYIDAGKQIPCSKCRKPNAVPISFFSFTCKCGRPYRLAANLKGLKLRCKHCGNATEINENTSTIEGMPSGSILFNCPHLECKAPLVQKSSFAGKTMQCPACKKVLQVPTKSTFDPIPFNLSIRLFQMPTEEIKKKCPLCGKAIVKTCPQCGNVDLSQKMQLLCQEDEVLLFLQQPVPERCVALSLGREEIYIAHTDFFTAGSLLYLEFALPEPANIKPAIFRVKSFTPFMTERRILQYTLLPLPDNKDWLKKREAIFNCLGKDTFSSLSIAREK